MHPFTAHAPFSGRRVHRHPTRGPVAEIPHLGPGVLLQARAIFPALADVDAHLLGSFDTGFQADATLVPRSGQLQAALESVHDRGVNGRHVLTVADGVLGDRISRQLGLGHDGLLPDLQVPGQYGLGHLDGFRFGWQVRLGPGGPPVAAEHHRQLGTRSRVLAGLTSAAYT